MAIHRHLFLFERGVHTLRAKASNGARPIGPENVPDFLAVRRLMDAGDEQFTDVDLCLKRLRTPGIVPCDGVEFAGYVDELVFQFPELRYWFDPRDAGPSNQSLARGITIHFQKTAQTEDERGWALYYLARWSVGGYIENLRRLECLQGDAALEMRAALRAHPDGPEFLSPIVFPARPVKPERGREPVYGFGQPHLYPELNLEDCGPTSILILSHGIPSALHSIKCEVPFIDGTPVCEGSPAREAFTLTISEALSLQARLAAAIETLVLPGPGYYWLEDAAAAKACGFKFVCQLFRRGPAETRVLDGIVRQHVDTDRFTGVIVDEIGVRDLYDDCNLTFPDLPAAQFAVAQFIRETLAAEMASPAESAPLAILSPNQP